MKKVLEVNLDRRVKTVKLQGDLSVLEMTRIRPVRTLNRRMEAKLPAGLAYRKVVRLSEEKMTSEETSGEMTILEVDSVVMTSGDLSEAVKTSLERTLEEMILGVILEEMTSEQGITLEEMTSEQGITLEEMILVGKMI